MYILYYNNYYVIHFWHLYMYVQSQISFLDNDAVGYKVPGISALRSILKQKPSA